MSGNLSVAPQAEWNFANDENNKQVVGAAGQKWTAVRHDVQASTHSPQLSEVVAVAVGDVSTLQWSVSIGEGRLMLTIPTGDAIRFSLIQNAAAVKQSLETLTDQLQHSFELPNLQDWTHGGPARWPQELKTQPITKHQAGEPFAVDVLTHPVDNPWFCRIRLTGLDFMPDANIGIVSAWDGSIWQVTRPEQPENGLTWRRIASGLFQPLGVKSGRRTDLCHLPRPTGVAERLER
ncbi:MAG: hypothetical protein R3C28_09985 [Pirellulaceae bacterium]